MRALRTLFFLALPASALVASCVDGEGPAAPEAGGKASLAVRSFSWPSEGVVATQDVNRIRVRVLQVPENATLGELSVDVDPADEEWVVPVEFDVPPGGAVQVVLEILLIHVAPETGHESVQWSALAGPFTVSSGSTTDVPDVPLIRGPLDNLAVTSVAIVPDPAGEVVEGGTVQLSAEVGTDDPTVSPVVFWVSLDPGVAAAGADGTVTGVSGGTARIVAEAGAHADTAEVTVLEEVDLQLGKVADAEVVGEGQTVTFEVTVSNAGPSDATGVEVADALPAGLSLVSASASAGSYADGVWAVGELAGGAAATLTLEAAVETGMAGETITNTASLGTVDQTDSDPGNDVATASVRVEAVDLAVAKSVDDPEPGEAETVVFTVTVGNAGPDAAIGVVVADALPEGLTLVSAAPSAGAYDAGTGAWTVGDLGVEATATLTLETIVDAGTAGQTITNSASVEAVEQGDTDATNDAASASITVQAVDLALAKVVDDPTPNEGDVVTFTVTLTNSGPDAATGVAVADALPAGLTFSGADATVGAYDEVTGKWTVGEVAAAGTATLGLVASVDAGTRLLTVTNTASVLAVDQADTDATNDEASASLTVNDVPQDLTYATSGNTQMITGAFPVPTSPHKVHANGVLAGTPTLTVTSTGTLASVKGGTVVMQEDGDFSYVPPAGLAAPDTFTYTVDAGTSAIVEVVPSGMIWYVNNTAGAGAGTGVSDDPFGELSLAQAAAGLGERIFVHTGDGTTTGQDQGIFLGTDQVLEGEGVALVDGADTLWPAGTPPLVSAPGTTPAVAMSVNNTVRGLTVDGAGGDGIRALEAAGGTIADVLVRNAGGGGVHIAFSTGTFTVTGLSVENATGAALRVDGGDAVIDVDVAAGSITNASGPLLEILATAAGGSVTLTGGGLTDDGGTGILVDDNAGSVEVQNPVTITSPTGDAVWVNNNTGAVSLLNLDVTASGGRAVGAVNNTGTVTLAGSAASTGGQAVYFLDNAVVDASFTSVVANNVGGTFEGVLIYNCSCTTTIGLLDVVTDPQTGVDVRDAGTFRVTDPASRIVSDGLGAFTGVGTTGGLLLDVVLGTLTANVDRGIQLFDVAGTLDVLGGSITTVAGSGSEHGVLVSGGTVDLSYGGSITNANARSVGFQSGFAGTATFSGPITDTGGGILLQGNAAGSTVDFTGTLDLASTTATAFRAIGGGTVNVTGTGNTVTTTTSIGIEIANTTIGAGGVTFESVSVDGAANGIILNSTGPRGLSVTGTGPAGSGGTIQNTTGDAVTLTAANDVSFTHLDVSNAGGSAIRGSGVGGLTVDGARIAGSASSALQLLELAGNSAITNTTISGTTGTNALVNTGEVLSLDLTGSALRTASGTGFAINTTGAGSASVLADGTTFELNGGSGFFGFARDQSSLTVFVQGGSLFDSNTGEGLSLDLDGDAQVSLEVQDATFSGNGSAGLLLNTRSTSTAAGGFRGFIASNTFTDNLGGIRAGGIEASLQGAAQNVLAVESNSVTQTPDAHGVVFNAGGAAGDTGTLDLVAVLNTITHGVNTSGDPLRITTTGGTRLCLGVGDALTADDNEVAVGIGTGVVAVADAASVYQVEDLTGTSALEMETFLLERTDITVLNDASQVSASGTFSPVALGDCQRF